MTKKDNNKLKQKICKILKKVAPQITDFNLKQFSNGKSITDLKIIDSLNFVTLLCELENVFGVKLTPEVVSIENFETLEKIIKFLRAKIQ